MNQECINCIQRLYFLSIGTTNETTTETTTTTMESSKLSLTSMNKKNVYLLNNNFLRAIYRKSFECWAGLEPASLAVWVSALTFRPPALSAFP